MIATFVAGVLSFLTFHYLFWKRLKEDYVSNMLFTTSFYALFGFGIVSLVYFVWHISFWFWLGLFLSLLGLFIGIIRFRLQIVETIDAYIGASIPVLFFVFMALFINSRNNEAFILSLLFMFLYFAYRIVDKHYKKFTWYRSGKIGFTGFFIAGIFFLIRGLIALFSPNMISFVGRVDTIISAVLAFVSFLILFHLSRKRS